MILKINSAGKKTAQSIVEYIIMLLVITVGIMIFFGGPKEFEPATKEASKKDNFFTKLKIKAAFDAAVKKAAQELNKQ